MSTFPCISLWQPWASLIFVGEPAWRKKYETRSFQPPAKYVGKRVGIQAAAGFPSRRHISADLDRLCGDAFGNYYRRDLPRGAILGTVIIESVSRTEEARFHVGGADLAAGDYGPSRWAWKLIDPIPLALPLPCVGRQGWFTAEFLAPFPMETNPHG